MSPPEFHPDPIVRDLQTIRRLRWSRPKGFERLETLLTHPLIDHFAFQPKKERQRVKALEAALREIVERIREREGGEPALGRSLADAAAALLRLEPEFDRMSLEEIRSHIASVWEEQGGRSLTPDGFRQHLENPRVYEPLAGEFREFAEEQSEDYSSKGVADWEGRDGEEPVGSHFGEERSAPATVAEELRSTESRLYERHRQEIGEGMLRIRSEEEMFEVLLTLTRAAKREFLAVDYVDISEWFGSPRLYEYLMKQLKRVESEGISLDRIRVVREEELEYENRSREQLENFIKLHKEAGATLLLCREETLKKRKKDLHLRFAPHVGLFLIDSREEPEGEARDEPAGVTGKLSKDGAIGRARVYVGDHPELHAYRREYEKLEKTALAENEAIEKELERLR